MNDLLTFFTDRTNAIVQLTEKLAQYESPTHDKVAVDTLGDVIQAEFEALQAEVEVFPRQDVGNILLARWNAAHTTHKPILILTHRDTVWKMGTLGNDVPLYQEDGKLHGPGVLDMKAGIAIAIEAIRGLQEQGIFPESPLYFLNTSDEETGSEHSRELIVDIAKQCDLVLVMEPAAENEGLKTSRKGIGRYWITAQGKASHAGAAPEEGVNAIIELAHQALDIHRLNQLRKGTSVSVTTIEGGSAQNVIPPHANLYVDVRFFYREEAQRVDAAIKNLKTATFGAKLEIHGGIDRYPLERNDKMVEAYQQARNIAGDIGFSLAEAAVGGVSDGNITAAEGIPTLDGMGAHGNGMHALHEHVLIRSLPRRAALLAGILQQWTP